MPDGNLRAAIAEVLGIVVTQSQPLTASDLATLRELDLTGRGIVDLTGLQFATNLHRLYLGWNHISDLSPLTVGMAGTSWPSNLEVLTLDGNAISNLTPLGTLTNLKSLSLDFNPIVDVTPLASLVNLEFLSIDGRYSNDLAATVPGGLTAGFGMLREITNPTGANSSFGQAIATMDTSSARPSAPAGRCSSTARSPASGS
jgi:hypothetical protein